MPITDNSDLITEFARVHKFDDPATLILKYGGKDIGFDLDLAVIQIEARRKTATKLKSFVSHPEFIFPSILAAEQASDELVGRYHASLVGHGHKVCDMTAGLGIDSMSVAMGGNDVTAIDIDRDKTEALWHNARVMGIHSLSAVCGDSTEFIRNTVNGFDTFFIDPARRRYDNSRTYFFKDCVPDVTSFYQDIMARGARLFIKASPLLDISSIREQFDSLASIHVVCVRGECKETLLELRPNASLRAVTAVNLTDGGIDSIDEITQEYLHRRDFPTASVEDIVPGIYLYEPNAALMKINSSAYLCNKYQGLTKIANNTHLYISDVRIDDFPGRKLMVDMILDRKRQRAMKGMRYNVAVRNYPEPAENLRRRLGIKEGGDSFIYGFRAGINESPIIVSAHKI